MSDGNSNKCHPIFGGSVLHHATYLPIFDGSDLHFATCLPTFGGFDLHFATCLLTFGGSDLHFATCLPIFGGSDLQLIPCLPTFGGSDLQPVMCSVHLGGYDSTSCDLPQYFSSLSRHSLFSSPSSCKSERFCGGQVVRPNHTTNLPQRRKGAMVSIPLRLRASAVNTLTADGRKYFS